MELPQRAKGLSGSQGPPRQSSTERSAKLSGGSWDRRLEAQEAWSKDSRKGLLAGLLGETIFQDHCVGTPHAAYKGIRVAAGPTRTPPLNPEASEPPEQAQGTQETSSLHQQLK